MEFWFWILIIAVPILSILGWVFWIVVGWLFVKKTMDVAAQSQQEMNLLLSQLDQALRAAATAEGQSASGGGGVQRLPPQQQLQIQSMLLQAKNQMTQLDSVSQQRYEGRLSELSGIAAEAGIDWTPGSY